MAQNTTPEQPGPVSGGRCLCSHWIVPLAELGRACPNCRRAICTARHYAERVAALDGPDWKLPAGGCEHCEREAAHQLGEWRAAASEGSEPTGQTLPEPAGNMRGPSVLRRQRRRWRQRPITFAPWATTVAEQLAELSPAVERVYLLGDRPKGTAAGVVEWARGQLPAGWQQSPRGHYVTGSSPVLRYERVGGRPVELHRADSWFPGAVDAQTCEQAWQLLAELVAQTWDEGTMLATPATTGRHLLLRSIPHGQEWPTLNDEAQQLIRSSSGQGRIELFPHDELPELHQWDGRFAYAALCWGMPAGECRRGVPDKYDPTARGRYLVRVTVPDGWTGPGLLPRHERDGSWSWPAQPRRRWQAWVDGAELSIAARCGWRFTITDALVWERYTTRGPLDTWARQLQRVREVIDSRSAVGAVAPEVAELARAGARQVLITSVGAMHGRDHNVTRMTTDPAEVPHGAEGLTIEGDTFVWRERRPVAWPELSHPEWSAAVWGRARARLLSAPTGTRGVKAGLLHLPEGVAPVAVRTDALYLTGAPGWPDDGAVGRFRPVRVLPGPIPHIGDHAELLRLREAV